MVSSPPLALVPGENEHLVASVPAKEQLGSLEQTFEEFGFIELALEQFGLLEQTLEQFIL